MTEPATEPATNQPAPVDLGAVLQHCKETEMDVIIRPADASAGRLDGDEKVRVLAGLGMAIAGLALVLLPLGSANQDLITGSGLAMIPGGFALAGGAGKKSS